MASFGSSTTQYNVNSFSFTHTPSVTPSGIIVSIYLSGGFGAALSITYGGVSMTQAAIRSFSALQRGYIFTLASPPTGAQTVAVTSDCECWVVVTTVAGGNSSKVLEPVSTAYNAGPAPWTIAIDVPSSRLGFGAWMAANNAGDSAITAQSPATSLVNYGTASRWLAIASQAGSASSISWQTGYYNGESLIFAAVVSDFIVEYSTPSLRVVSGNPAYLQVVAPGATSYQWQDNRTGSFANVTDGTGGTTANYVTAVLTTAATGRQYRCVVSDGTTNLTSTAATITVDAATTGSLGQFDPELRLLGWW